jgi:hypothetical protein
VLLTDDLTDQFTVAYEELLPYLNVAAAFRWDHPDDVYARPPYTYGSKSSRLMTLLDDGHHGVDLSAPERLRLVNWIDANGVYYDCYESDAYGSQRKIFSGALRQRLNEIHARRCASCHGAGDGRHDTWWLSLNRREVARSRVLAAPLARAAGGWQRCAEPVFQDTRDPDYVTLSGALGELQRALAERPREDLVSLRGSDAERQVVEPAPPPAHAACGPETADNAWIWLSNLPWRSARAGWTRNGDGQPRRDRDVEDQPLRLERRTYRKGLGTHAPSEIVYALDGRYDRFVARIGGAEDRGTVEFQVYGDDRPLYASGVLRGLQGSKSIDVKLEGVQVLRLVVTDGGDNYFADMANWADARVHQVQPDPRSPSAPK